MWSKTINCYSEFHASSEAISSSTTLLSIALVQLLSTLIADEDFNSMFGYIYIYVYCVANISKNKAFLVQDLTYK